MSLGAGKFCKCGICKASWRAEEWFSISARSRLPQLASLQACVVESFVSSVTLAFASFLPPSNTNVHSLERRTGELTNALHHLTSSLQSLVFCVYPHWFAHCVLFHAAHTSAQAPPTASSFSAFSNHCFPLSLSLFLYFRLCCFFYHF